MRAVCSSYVAVALRVQCTEAPTQKLHGVVRPLSLKTDVIKKR